MEYKKYLTPFWIQREKEIEENFKDGDFSKFWNDKNIIHTMIMDGHYLGTAISHIQYLYAWQKYTGKEIKNIKSIIELGGGYGSLCRIVKGINQCLYTIVDLPIVNKIQQYFLKNETDINYVGLDKLEETNFECEMFISTFALSESTYVCMEYVIEKNFFNAKYLLLSFNKKDEDNFKIEKMIQKFKEYGTIIDMDDNHYYLIK